MTASSEKELAAPTFKRGFGFHPLFAFVDHGETGSGETVGAMLRTGSAGANTAADHITPASTPRWLSCRVLVRAGTGGGSRFLHHMTDFGLAYSVGHLRDATDRRGARQGPSTCVADRDRR